MMKIIIFILVMFLLAFAVIGENRNVLDAVQLKADNVESESSTVSSSVYKAVKKEEIYMTGKKRAEEYCKTQADMRICSYPVEISDKDLLLDSSALDLSFDGLEKYDVKYFVSYDYDVVTDKYVFQSYDCRNFSINEEVTRVYGDFSNYSECRLVEYNEEKTDLKIFKDYQPIPDLNRRLYLKRPSSLLGQWSMSKSESAHFNVTVALGNRVLRIDPIIGISTCTDLQGMRDNFNANYELLADINCSDTVNWNDGKGFIPIGNTTNPFTGNLTGNNHTIYDLYINRNETYVGLFGNTNTKQGNFTNFGIINGWVNGMDFASLVFGTMQGKANVQNIFATGTLNQTGSNAGLLIGWAMTGTSGGELIMHNSYAIGNLTSTGTGLGLFAGLISSQFGNFLINNSYSVGNITTSSTTNNPAIGGFFGIISNFRATVRVTNCFTDSFVNSTYGTLQMAAFAGGYSVTSGTNITWNNKTGTYPYCYGVNGNTNCNAVQDNTPYFYDISNEPLKYWDFINAWNPCFNKINYPILIWQSCPPLIPPKPVNYTMTTEVMNQTQWFNTEEITKSQLSGSMLYILLLAIIIFCHAFSEITKIPAFFVMTGIMTFFFGIFIFSVFSAILGISMIAESVLFSIRGFTVS